MQAVPLFSRSTAMPSHLADNSTTDRLPEQVRQETDRQRRHLLVRVSRLLDWPMTVLSLFWLALLVRDFTHGLSVFLERLNLAIWGAFIAHFVLEWTIAPDKFAYVRRNWLTAIALLLP